MRSVVALAAVFNSPLRPGVVPSGVEARTVRLHPGDDLAAAVAANPPGTAFFLEAGTYRMQSVTPKDGDAFTGTAGAVLSGARLLTDFQRSGPLWVTEATAEPTPPRGQCAADSPGCTLPEDLFIDDVSLRRSTGLDRLAPGSWYLDYAAGRVYLADNPAGHRVEISLAQHAFSGLASNVTIRGLVIEKYANPAQTGAIDASADGERSAAPDWVVEGNEVRWNHGGGIRLGPGMRVVKNQVHHNGQIGIAGSGRNILVDGNEIAYNNYAGYSYGWEAGGTKFVATEGLVVRNNFVHHNQGPGLWTDIDNRNSLYENNRTTANLVAGIFHEISFQAVIRHNTIENDGFDPAGRGPWRGSGIRVSASSGVEIYENRVANCMNGIVAIQPERGMSMRYHTPRLVQDLDVHGNTIVQTEGIAAGLARDARHFDDSIFTRWHNRFENNRYTLADPGGRYFLWMNAARTKSEWQSFGNDRAGEFVFERGSGSRDSDIARPPRRRRWPPLGSAFPALEPPPAGFVARLH
jgi:parallel beta helix pectate lyase-like protein